MSTYGSQNRWLEELYQERFDMFYGLAMKRLQCYGGDREKAADIVQDAFLLASQKLSEDHPNPGGWISKTIDNNCRNESRAYIKDKIKVQKCQEKFAEGHKLRRTQSDETSLIELKMTLKSELPPEEYKLIMDCCVNGKPIEEIMKEEETTYNALHVRICKIRKKMRKILFAQALIILGCPHIYRMESADDV